MSTKRYTKSNIGVKFNFIITKQVFLAPENEEYFIIEDDQASKFLIPKKDYAHYNFQIGQQIVCYFDRINCKGRLFFEPENPLYRKNECYRFDLLKLMTLNNYFGLKEQIALVNDVFGKEQWIRNAKNIDPNGKKVEAVVISVKKGKLYLVEKMQYDAQMRIDGTVPFKIVGTKHTSRFNETFILEDIWGNNHVMSKAYYANYSLVIGQWFQGTIQKLSSKGFFYIEPLHPIYKIGETYDFELVEIISDNGDSIGIVTDVYNNMVKVKIPNNSHTVNTKINCVIENLVKGLPVLMFNGAVQP